MVSKLIKDGNIYRCSNCKMRQPENIKSNCIFCGDMFMNETSILIQEYEEQFKNNVGDNNENTCKLY